MGEDTDRMVSHSGRTMRVTSFGDNAEEVELYAIDKAREFFGSDVRLEVVRDYRVFRIGPHSPNAPTGKKYGAEITVRTIES